MFPTPLDFNALATIAPVLGHGRSLSTPRAAPIWRVAGMPGRERRTCRFILGRRVAKLVNAALKSASLQGDRGLSPARAFAHFQCAINLR